MLSNIIATIIIIFAVELILFVTLAIYRTIAEKFEAKSTEGEDNEM